MKLTLAIFLAAATALADPVTFESADGRVVLLELFTSEGCSSCPRADAAMSALKTSPDLWKKFVPVVFHVDYWDRLGWPDRFASAAFTQRQHRYASAWSANSVYTPGFVVNGREARGGIDGRTLSVASGATAGRLRLTQRDPQHAEALFLPAGKAPAALSLEVALLGSGLKTDVQRGENVGRKLAHDFVVLHHQRVRLVPGEAHFSASVVLPEKTSAPATAIAAWVTAGDSQEPLQAVGGWLAKP